MVIFVDVTKMYAMIYIVSYKKPARVIWLSFIFYGMRAMYISKRYNVMDEYDQCGGAMDLGVMPVA
jgi:hypothetical protein